jgi:molecular chaperone DnaK
MIRVPVVEGEHEHRADRNTLIGYLEFKGDDPQVRRDVPQGADIEITLEVDASRVVRARAEIPIIEMEVEVVLNTEGYQARNAAEIRADLDLEVQRMGELSAQAREASASSAMPPARRAEAEALVQQIGDLAVSAQGDVDAAKEAEKRLLELKGKLDLGEQSVEWPAAVKESQEVLEETRGLVGEAGGKAEKQMLEEIEPNLQRALEAHDLDLLRDAIEELRSLGFRVLHGRLEFWVGYLEYLEETRGAMQDRALADRLFARARESVVAEDLTALRATIRQLIPLLPQEERAAAEARGFGGGTMRG